MFFFVLERVNGDLTHKMLEWKEQTSRHGFFSKGSRDLKMSMFRERVELLCDLASALAYLHERHVIHRDVSLSNVGIGSRGGKVKLLDFGLAKVLPPCRDENEKFLLTGTTGSLRYMAPEIGSKQPYNLKADVYSFAILLYEVLSLEKVFHNWQSHEIFDRVQQKKFRPRMSFFWSQQIKELLRRCWSHNSSDRLPMKDAEDALQRELIELQAMDSSSSS